MKSTPIDRRSSRAKTFSIIQILLFFSGVILTARAQQPTPSVSDLVIGQPTTRVIKGQEIHIYTIDLKRGQVLRVTFAETGADIGAVIARDSDGQKMSAASNFGNGFLRESITARVDQDGLYGVVLRAQQVTAEGTVARYEMNATLSDRASGQDTERARAETLLEEGFTAFMNGDKGNSPQALLKIAESARIFHAIGDTYWEAVARYTRGACLLKENPAGAKPDLEASLKTFEQMNLAAGIGAAAGLLGTAYVLEQNLTSGGPYLARALKIAREIGDKRSEDVLNTLRAANMVTEQAIGDYAQRIAQARKKDDKPAEALIWTQTLSHYANDDSIDDDVRLALFKRAEAEGLTLVRRIGERDFEMQLLIGLGLGYSDIEGDNEDETKAYAEKAFHHFIQSYLMSTAADNHLLQAASLMGLSLNYYADNDKLAIFFGKKAINSIQELRRVFRSVGGPTNELSKDIAKGVEEEYGSLAGDLIGEGRFEEAHQVVNFIRDQEFYDFTPFPAQSISKLTFTTRETEAELVFNGAVTAALTKYGSRPGSNIEAAGRDLRDVLNKLEQNFIVQATEKDIVRSVTETRDLQSALGDVSTNTGKRHVALYMVDGVDDMLLITPNSIKAFSGWGRAVNLDDNTGYISGEVEKLRASGVSQAQAQEKLNEIIANREKERVYMAADERILDFLNALRSPKSDPKPLASIVYKRVFKTREIAGGKLATTLEAELEKYKPDVLLWSLNGNIRYVPMAALYDAEKKQYLLEKYQNVVFTRSQKTRFLVSPKPWTEGIGFGTSVAYRGHAPLINVQSELATIFGNAAGSQKGLFSGPVLLNKAFTRQAMVAELKAKRPLVHIASHFTFMPGDANNSFLLLGDGERFRLNEIRQNLDLFEGVDLLTLSACETAAQQPGANGREIDGFAELAQRLGANSVLATLWQIPDDGASSLMTEFYRLRRAKPAALKSEVLREAQLNLLYGNTIADGDPFLRFFGAAEARVERDFKLAPAAPFEHPYYWAPFVLFGNSR